MLLLALAGLLHAADPAPGTPADTDAADAPAETPEGTPAEGPPALGTTPPPLGARVAGETIEVTDSQEVLRRRAAVFQELVDEGYTRRIRRDDRTIFLSEDPWKPRVIVHDDGWVYFKRQPPRLHAPGRSFADQGTPASYLLCIVMPTSCISVGGWLVSPRKLGGVQASVMDETKDEVRAMNDAVARRELGRRLNEDIPRDLERVWARVELPAAQRRALLFEYWDLRTDTPEGESAKRAIEAFLRGVVQQSDTPFTPEELAALNAKRQSLAPLSLAPPSLEE
ncbi:MAG: hypothetical protein ACK4YP_08040 [Myxococcota bacterium]